MIRTILLSLVALVTMNTKAQDDLSDVFDDGKMTDMSTIVKVHFTDLFLGRPGVTVEQKIGEMMCLEVEAGMFSCTPESLGATRARSQYFASHYNLPEFADGSFFSFGASFKLYANYNRMMAFQNQVFAPKGWYYQLGFRTRSGGLESMPFQEWNQTTGLYTMYSFEKFSTIDTYLNFGAQMAFGRVMVDAYLGPFMHSLSSMDLVSDTRVKYSSLDPYGSLLDRIAFQAGIKVGFALR